MKEGSEPAVLSISGVSLVLSNIKDTWPECARVCAPMCLCVVYVEFIFR